MLANFLVLIFLLNVILFRPMLKLFQERKKTVDDSHNAAEALKGRKDELFAEMQAEMSRAREMARERYLSLRNEGATEHKTALDNAQQRAVEMIHEAQERIREDSSKARERLKAEVEKYSDEIVSKLVRA